jgi:hypothetical protein
MLVNLTKKEIEVIIDALRFQMTEADSLDDFDDITNEEVGFKLHKLLGACECQAQQQSS